MQPRIVHIAVMAFAFCMMIEPVLAKTQDGTFDEAYLESLRTEVHPKNPPEVSEGVLFRSKVVIGKAGKRDLTGDVFTPKNIPSEPRPAIVFLHGGSWMFGSPSQFHLHSDYLARKYGFFAVSVDYRLSGEAQFPAALHDAKCAIRWVRSHAKKLNIDPDRVAICGGSAGGHLSSMIATTATLLLHGTEDRCVSHEQAVAFYSRLREAGVHAELAICEGKPHAWFNKEPDKTKTLERMEKFLVARFGLEKDKD